MLVKLQLSLPAQARYVGTMRGVADRVMADVGVPAPTSDDIQLAVGEACANAVRHADVARYVVCLEISDAGCGVDVVDVGRGFDPATVPAGKGTERDNGRGLLLMQSLVDDLEFVRETDGTHVRLWKRWKHGFPAQQHA